MSLHYSIYLGLIALGFVAGLRRHRKERSILPVVVLLGVTVVSETIAKLLALSIGNNNIVYHFYHPIQVVLWGDFFYQNLRSKVRKTVWPITIGLIVFSLFNTLVLQSPETFPSNIINLEGIMLLFLSFSLFLEFLDRPSREDIFRNSAFIIAIGLMWFTMISFPFFNFFNDYLTRGASDEMLRLLHRYSNLMYYAILLSAMLLKPYRTGHEH